MSMSTNEMLLAMGIKRSWLADKLAIPESTLRHFCKTDNVDDDTREMIIRVLDHAYHNYFLPYKEQYENGKPVDGSKER